MPFAGGHLEYLKFLKHTRVGSFECRKCRVKWSRNRQKTLVIQKIPVGHLAIWTSNLWYTFTFALDYIMDDVINCFHLGINVVFLLWPWEHSRNRDHTAIGIISEMTAKRHFSYLYGGHLETCHTYIFYFIIIGFLDPENIRIYTKIVLLSGLQVKTSPKTDCCVTILFLPSKKIPQGCQAGIRLIPTQ